MIAAAVQADARYRQAEVIVPVPSSKASRRSRGFNQAYLLSSAVHQALRLPVYQQVLLQVKEGRFQHELSREDREVNRKGAFQAVPSRRLTGQTVLLIDDVMTTGATCRECAQALLEAGAKDVLVAVWAAGVGF
jgi:ComF family protein